MSLTAARRAALTTLAEVLGCPAHPVPPARPIPPFVYLTEQSEFVRPAEDGVFGEYTVAFSGAVVLPFKPDNAEMIADADTVADTLLGLWRSGVAVEIDGYTMTGTQPSEWLAVPFKYTLPLERTP